MEKGFTLENGESRLNVMPYFPNDTSRLSGKRMQNTGKQTLAFAEAGTEIAVSATYTGFSAAVTLPEGANSVAFTLSGDVQTVTADGQTVTVTLTDGTAVEYAVQSFSDGVYELDYAGLSVAVSSVRDGYRITYTADEAVAAKTQQIVLALAGTVTEANNGAQTRNAGESLPNTSYYMDAGVYSNYPSTNYGSSDRGLVGVDATMGICRTYVKFNLSTIEDIPYDRILSANYYVRELTAYTTPFHAQAHLVTGAWTEDGITWNNKPSYDSEVLTTVSLDWSNDLGEIHSRNRYDFYITKAVLAWLRGMPNYGIMIKSRIEGEVSCRALATREYSIYVPVLSVTYTTDTTSMDNIGIVDGGEYYIQNKQSGYYLTAEGTANYSNVIQRNFNSENLGQKWKVERVGALSGEEEADYYRLIPMSSINADVSIVLDVAGNADGADVRMALMSASMGQQFKFIRNWDGSYKIVTRQSSDEKGLRTQANTNSYGGNIDLWTQSVDWTKSDDWTLHPILKGDADVYSFTESDDYNLNTEQYTAEMVEYLEGMGYSTYSIVDEESAIAYAYSSLDSIFVFTGHGGLGCLAFKNNTFLTATETSGNTIAISRKPHNDFAKMKLAIFACCMAGLDDSENNSNLVGMMYRKGTHFVSAHTDLQYSPVNDEWLQKVLYYCGQGKTIYEAMTYADSYVYSLYGGSVGNTNQRHLLGDSSLRIDL